MGKVTKETSCKMQQVYIFTKYGQTVRFVSFVTLCIALWAKCILYIISTIGIETYPPPSVFLFIGHLRN